MPISLYEATVPLFLQTLGGVEGYLDKALVHFSENGADPDVIVESRLHDDMLPFRFQIVSVTHHSRGAIEGVRAGTFSPPAPTGPLDFAALQSLVAEARAALQAVTPDEINALEGRDMVFQGRDRQLPFTAGGFLQSFSLPNFFFHAATAYGLLRAKGVPLGKRDYMGALRLKV